MFALPSATNATENMDVDVPDNMYRSAVAIGYLEHVVNKQTGEIIKEKRLLGTGVLIYDGRHYIVVTARHVILDKNFNLVPN